MLDSRSLTHTGRRWGSLGWLLATTCWLAAAGGLIGLAGCEGQPHASPANDSSSTVTFGPTHSGTDPPDLKDADIAQTVTVSIQAFDENGQMEPVTGASGTAIVVAWQKGMTVFAATSAMEPAVEIRSSGGGEQLFVHAIGGKANLGAQGDNWIYRVNGALGDTSCDAYLLEPGDNVLWTFGKYE